MYVVNYDLQKTDIKANNNTQSKTWIDKLFNGETEPIIITTESPTLRTRTYNVDIDADANTDIETLVNLNVIDGVIERNPTPGYKTFNIPKKTHGYRTINAPDDDTKRAMKTVAEYLGKLTKYKFHDSAWAYVPNRDIVKAMKEHTNNKSKWYLKIDLKKFFDSCTPEFIETQLKQVYPFGAVYLKDTEQYKRAQETIHKLVNWCTLEGLPQGTPISPILTNIIMIPIDYQITKFLNHAIYTSKINKQRYVYTRYADDIIISAKTSFDYKVIENGIKHILRDTPLKINTEKTRYGSSAGRNWNLGVMCNKDNNVTVGYRRKQMIKVVVNNFIKDGENWELNDLQYLQGQLSWIQNVEPEYFEGLIKYFNNKYNLDVKKKLTNLIKIKMTNN